MKFVKQAVRASLRYFGFDLIRYVSPQELDLNSFDPLRDFTAEQKGIITRVKPFTMTSEERIACLINAVTYVATRKVEGDIAECGVWRGGSMMTIALTLLAHGDTTRSLYLYDTFEGMSSPTKIDKNYRDESAESQLKSQEKGTGIWCYASLEEVTENLLSTGYPSDKIHFVQGKVEDTIPGTTPKKLSLLRLDTDWYESTKHELVHLYPALDKKGVLIIDDYGHWKGSKKAVDEYFQENDLDVYLHRIDYTGRIAVGLDKLNVCLLTF
jgi:hypothetical protein